MERRQGPRWPKPGMGRRQKEARGSAPASIELEQQRASRGSGSRLLVDFNGHA